MVEKTRERGQASSRSGFRLRLPGSRDRSARISAPRGRKRHENPDSGMAIEQRITLFHDADEGSFACTIGDAPRIRLTTYQFSGTYISLAVGLRKSDLANARAGTDLALVLDATATRPIPMFARLNLRTPEKTETLYETVLLHRSRHELRFPIDAAQIRFSQLEAGWMDLIFSRLKMSEIDIRELDYRFDQTRLRDA